MSLGSQGESARRLAHVRGSWAPRITSLIGKELGARYVIEGSVRQAGAAVRIAVRLVDAGSGALLGFMMLHLAAMAHFLGQQRSRNWLRHLVVPTAGLAIVVYVLVNAHTEARSAGTLRMVAGLALFFGLKLAGRSTALRVEEPRADL